MGINLLSGLKFPLYAIVQLRPQLLFINVIIFKILHSHSSKTSQTKLNVAMSRSIGLIVVSRLLCLSSLAWLAASEGGQFRDWNKVIEVATRIGRDHATIGRAELMLALRDVEQALQGRIINDVPMNVDQVHRVVVANALGLLRMTKVSYERCLAKDLVYAQPNLHRGNYIELNHALRNNFESQNMVDFIDEYFQAQLFICRHGLIGHFGVRLSRVIKDQGKSFQRFRQNILAADRNFKQEIDSLHALTLFMQNFQRLENMQSTHKTRCHTAEQFIDQLSQDCTNYVIIPFRALIMTYEFIGRAEVPALELKYGDIIRIYDVCGRLQEYPKGDKIKAVDEKAFSHRSVASLRPIAPLAPVEPLPPIDSNLALRKKPRFDETRIHRPIPVRENLPTSPWVALSGILDSSSMGKQKPGAAASEMQPDSNPKSTTDTQVSTPVTQIESNLMPVATNVPAIDETGPEVDLQAVNAAPSDQQDEEVNGDEEWLKLKL